jgi:hypothetical protein
MLLTTFHQNYSIRHPSLAVSTRGGPKTRMHSLLTSKDHTAAPIYHLLLSHHLLNPPRHNRLLLPLSPPPLLPPLSRSRHSKHSTKQPRRRPSLKIHVKRRQQRPRLDQIAIRVRRTNTSLPPNARIHLKHRRNSRARSNASARTTLARPFVRRLGSKSSQHPTIITPRPQNRETALGALQVAPAGNLVHAEVPVGRFVDRRQQPGRDFDVAPGMHDGVQNRQAVFLYDLRVFDFAAHLPDFAAVVAERERALGHELLEGVAAGWHGVAECCAVGEVAVFGLGGCWKV